MFTITEEHEPQHKSVDDVFLTISGQNKNSMAQNDNQN